MAHPGFPPFMPGVPTPPASSPPAKPPVVEVTQSKLIKIGNEYYRATVIDESGHSKMLSELTQDKIEGLVEVVKEIVKSTTHFDEMQINAAGFEVKKGGKIKSQGKHDEALSKKIETIFTTAAAARNVSMPNFDTPLAENPSSVAQLTHVQSHTIVSQPLAQPLTERNELIPMQLHIHPRSSAPEPHIHAAVISENQNTDSSMTVSAAKTILREFIKANQPLSQTLQPFLDGIEKEQAVKASMTHAYQPPIQEVRDGIMALKGRYDLVKNENFPREIKTAVEVLYSGSAVKQVEELSALLIRHGGDKNKHSFKEITNSLRSAADIPAPELLQSIEDIQRGLQTEVTAILNEQIHPEEKAARIKALVATKGSKLKELIPQEQREIYKTLPLIDSSLSSAIGRLEDNLKFLNETSNTDQVSLEEFLKVFNTIEQFMVFNDYVSVAKQFLANKKQTGITGEVAHFIEKLKRSFSKPPNELESKILYRMTARLESAVKIQENLSGA